MRKKEEEKRESRARWSEAGMKVERGFAGVGGGVGARFLAH